jgi:hypothetical protein
VVRIDPSEITELPDIKKMSNSADAADKNHEEWKRSPTSMTDNRNKLNAPIALRASHAEFQALF